MARNGEEGDIESLQRAPSLPSSRPIRSKQSDPLLIVCKGFSLITCIVAIVCLVVNIISAINSFKTGSDIFNGIFRCYAVALAIFVVIAETEWGFIFKFWRCLQTAIYPAVLLILQCVVQIIVEVLEYWAGRGMLQIFVAVMTRAYPDISGKWKNVVLLQDIASYMLLSCGVIYIVSGVMCIGFLKRARQHKEISREQAVRDLEQLERRREELEQLLITHRT